MDNSISNLSIQINQSIDYNNFSNGILDTKLSRRYPITLDQARNRALRAIKKARGIDVC